MAQSYDVSLAQLRYFSKAAEVGSMTKAGQELFIAQSAVSTAISQLERTLGVQLFLRRRSKGLVLTSEGREFLGRANGILNAVVEAVDSASPGAIRGTIQVGFFQTLAPFYLAEVVFRLGQQFPHLNVSAREMTIPQLEAALRDGEIEVAFTYGLQAGAGISIEPLGRTAVYAAVGDQHPLVGRSSVALSELADEPMVLLDLPTSRDYFLGIFAQRQLTPRVQYRFESFETVRSMVARGHGYTILNQRPAYDVTFDGHHLCVLDIAECDQGLEIVAARLGKAPMTRKVEAFIATCAAAVLDRSADAAHLPAA